VAHERRLLASASFPQRRQGVSGSPPVRASHRERQRHDDPGEHDHLGIAEVVLRHSRDEKAREGREASGDQGALSGGGRGQPPKQTHRLREERGPEPQPRQQAGHTQLHEDLERGVVQMPCALHQSLGLHVVAIFALDAARPDPQPRVLPPHGDPAAPHVEPLLDGDIVGIRHRQGPLAQVLGAGQDRHAHYQEPDHQEPAPPPDRRAEGKDARSEADPGAPRVGRRQSPEAREPLERKPRAKRRSQQQPRQTHQQRQAQHPSQRHVAAEEAAGPGAPVVEPARETVVGLRARAEAHLQQADRRGPRDGERQGCQQALGLLGGVERVGCDIEGGDEQELLTGDQALARMWREQGRHHADRAERQDGAPERPAHGFARFATAQPAEPEQRQEGEGGLGERDGEAETQDERRQERATGGGHPLAGEHDDLTSWP
jgi:hypothetical protein